MLEAAQQTLEKIQGRREIDATEVQIRQGVVSVNSRKAFWVQAEKQVQDAQDELVRLMGDSAISLTDNAEVIPTSEPTETHETQPAEETELNPRARSARLRIAERRA